MPDDVKRKLISEGRRLGFDDVGLTRPERILAAGPRLHHFLNEGRHGDMSWLENNADRRADPTVLWPNARSAIVAAMSYAPEADPLTILSKPTKGSISVYAQGKDYHDILKGKLKQLARIVASETASDVKVFVDTAPLMEKPLAAAAGIGWQGKHTNLVSRQHGSWLFLGVILTAAELAVDEAEDDHCGSCQACLDICPTNAFPTPYQLDARRCIAYLTIEYKGHIAEEFRKPMANRVFGCDDCLAVCPWNKFAETTREARFSARQETQDPEIAELIVLDDQSFRKRFAGTPIKRTGRDRFVRNVLIAAGNSGDKTYIKNISERLRDESPLVRAMAIWALSQLLSSEEITTLSKHYLFREADSHVLREWEKAQAQ